MAHTGVNLPAGDFFESLGKMKKPPNPVNTVDPAEEELLTDLLGLKSKTKESAVEEPIGQVEEFKIVKPSNDDPLRKPKNMFLILQFFSNFFLPQIIDEKVIKESELDNDWLLNAYEKYVMTAKKVKAEMKVQGRSISFKGFHKKIIFTVRTGQANESIRSDVRLKRLTFPDFLACLSIMIISKNLQSELSYAPLGAHVRKVNEEAYRKSGLHICGHSGLSSIANFVVLYPKSNPGKVCKCPPLPDLVALAYFIDLKHSYDKTGQYSTLQALARTTGKSAVELIPSQAIIDEFEIIETASASRINASEVGETISGMLRMSNFKRNNQKAPVKEDDDMFGQ